MAEGKEDPFGSLIKFCQPTSSQERKLETCSFAREFEAFPDYFDSLATSSPETTPLDPVGIVIVSPPETDSQNSSSIDKSNTQENENFLTPPEHHNPSASSSSQEDPQRLKPVTPGDSKGSVSVVAETTVGDDGRAENEVSVTLGEGEKNLGFSETEKLDSRNEVFDDQCWDRVNEVGEFERFECELKRIGAFNSELDKPMSKKIRVLEASKDLEANDKMIDDDIIVLDTEEIDEEIQFDKGKIIIDVDTLAEEVAENGDGDVHEREKEKGVHKEIVPRGMYELTSSTKEKDMGGDKSIGNTGEVRKSKNSGSGSDINHREKEKDVALNGGVQCPKVNGILAPAASQEGISCNSNNKVHRNGKAVLGSCSIEKIEKFRYEGPGKGVDHSSNRRVAVGRRELPPSIRGNEEDMGGEESGGYIKVKTGSWKDLVDALEVVFGKVDDGCEDVDFLETAKRRGLTFPEPRWI